MLKPFDMEPRRALPKKPFVSKEENNCEEEISLKLQDKIDNIDWCKHSHKKRIVWTHRPS